MLRRNAQVRERLHSERTRRRVSHTPVVQRLSIVIAGHKRIRAAIGHQIRVVFVIVRNESPPVHIPTGDRPQFAVWVAVAPVDRCCATTRRVPQTEVVSKFVRNDIGRGDRAHSDVPVQFRAAGGSRIARIVPQPRPDVNAMVVLVPIPLGVPECADLVQEFGQVCRIRLACGGDFHVEIVRDRQERPDTGHQRFSIDGRLFVAREIHGDERHSKWRQFLAVQLDRLACVVFFVRLGKVVVRIDDMNELIFGLIKAARQLEHILGAPPARSSRYGSRRRGLVETFG